MKNARSLSLLLLILSCSLLAACGFALRGSTGDYQVPFKTVSMNVDENDFFGAMLKRQLRAAGTKVVKDSRQAEAHLEILQQERDRQTLSLTVAGRVREYALFYTFQFQVKGPGNIRFLEPVQLRLRRTLTYSESEAYAKEKEEERLYQDMEVDVIHQVVRRLANIEVTVTEPIVEPPL